VGAHPANFNAQVDGRFPHERTSARETAQPAAMRADLQCMTPMAWRAYLGAGAVAACVVLTLPAGPRAVLLIVVSASAALALAAGIKGYRPAGAAAWWLVAAGQGLFVLGDVLFSVNDLILHIEPFPSLADALYLAGYPALAAGLALLIRRRSTRRDTPALLDAAIIATGFGLITWVLVMVPYFRDPELALLERVVSLAYPVGDALLLALAAALAVAAGRRPVAYWLLVGNLVVTLVADTIFSVLALRGGDTGPTDAGYVVGYVLLGAAALHPSMVGLSEPAPERRARLSRGRLLAMGAAALVAPALLVVERVQGSQVEAAAVAGGWAVLFVLAAVRVVGLVRDIERAEAERRRLFDRTLQATEQERSEVAAELHDGPIQRLTALVYELEHAKRRLLQASSHAGAARLEQAQAALSAEVQGLRQLMVSLRPPVLDEVGLEAALRDQVGAFARRSGVDCSLRVALDERLGRELETVVYRITQEALYNVARHSRAGRLWLDLEETGERVRLEIRDDGVGFQPVPSSVLVRDGRFGLAGMRERVEMAGGSWQVHARPGGGVTIRASFRARSAA
jgi:signal transduction histidine kinase